MKRLLHSAIILIVWFVTAVASSAPVPPEVLKIIQAIQKADYEGNRTILKQAHDQLAAYISDKNFGSRAAYWCGFALWRRAINGFNEDSIDPKELEGDLLAGIEDFKKAVKQDPTFVDAKIGIVSSTGYIGYIHRDNPERMNEFRSQITPIVKELKESIPDHPRLIWIMGPWLWNTPVEKGGGPASAIESYKKGLELIRNQKTESNPLDPSWGEPELLMNLSWSYLNQPNPDIAAAEKSARDALAIVPYWHYVRDILLPQILEAKTKAGSKSQ